MQYLRARIIREMMRFFDTDDRRIEHALRVLFHAERLMPDYPESDPDIVVTSAALHDVGIKIAEDLHGHNTAAMQEEYGPAAAEKLLDAIDFPPEKTKIVKNIIGNHHSPSRYDYPELAVLKAADLIVNRDEKV